MQKKSSKIRKKIPKKWLKIGGGIPSGLLYYWVGYGHGGWPWWPGKKKIGGGIFFKKIGGIFLKKLRGEKNINKLVLAADKRDVDIYSKIEYQ